MGAFSASDAALEGFQVLGRHWRVVLGWCLFFVLAFVSLVVAATVGTFAITLASGSQAQAQSLSAGLGSLLVVLGSLAVDAALVTALYRLMLQPGASPQFFYLRFSRAEARLLGLWLSVLAGTGMLFVLGYVVLSQLGRASGAAAAWGAPVFALAVVWLLLRLSLAGPANFATGRFGLADSWRLTRGRFWPIAGAATIMLCLLAMIGVLVWLATFVVEAAIGGFHSFAPVSLSDPQALAERPGAYVFGMVAELVLGPVYWVIASAPFASIYRTLTAAEP